MAGESIVSGVVGGMVGRAMSLLAGQLLDQQPERSVEAKLRRLRRLLARAESAAEAAGARRITSRALLSWLAEIVDGARRGRYLLDAFPVPSGAGDQDDGHAGNKVVPLARSFSMPSSFNSAKRLRVAAMKLLLGDGDGRADELDGVLADLESVASGLTEFIVLLQMCPPALHRPLATSIYADSQMFVRHVERRRVFEFLLQDDEGEPTLAEPGVLPIIGSAGLGKTTLVQHVCEEPAVRRRFSLVMLLDFHCMSLMAAGETALFPRSLFTPNATSLSADGEQTRLLERKLRGERFLAVFDNVNRRKRQVVDAIMQTLRRAGRRGSKVVVTSSDAGHVAGLGTAEPIVLRPLPPEEYWFFFRAHAFGGAEADPRLAAAGQAIAKRLDGSFFGGKIVGALLRSRPDARLWRSVLSSSFSIADVWCLGSEGCVAAAAGSLLPRHVTMRCVTVSGSPMRGLVGIQETSLAVPAPPCPDDGGSRSPELPVLLCKSVFPGYCLYYTAHCTIDREINQ
ncbi:hypothetical protein CFC21_083018 [Triticum aestivum]|uniref:NB-ARC domain-containing protein n=3 Tax=Triticum TaxID=4564 RepID=A0A9R1L5Q5_WHEAT|nr:hypothetical protein CFC21_083015 [Triticum aestivum]KAF7078613.1 hypothetical protein CFC21_083018 [Triticum aestivum]